MKLIKPSFEIMTSIDRKEILTKIEKAGRTCYKSENNITEESASKFVKSIVDRGHLSVIEHYSVTVKIICDRGVSHELVRHRIASFSQESSRYCNYEKKGLVFIIPCWFKNLEEGEYDNKSFPQLHKDNLEYRWFIALYQIEDHYNSLIKGGWSPEQARSILPNSLKTEIVITANLREWKLIFDLRCSEKAHPQMREIMIPLRKEFQKMLPEIYGEIK